MHWQKASSQIIIRCQKILNTSTFSKIIQTDISQTLLIVKSPSHPWKKVMKLYSTNRVQVTEL